MIEVASLTAKEVVISSERTTKCLLYIIMLFLIKAFGLETGFEFLWELA